MEQIDGPTLMGMAALVTSIANAVVSIGSHFAARRRTRARRRATSCPPRPRDRAAAGLAARDSGST